MLFAARLRAYQPAGPLIGAMPWPLTWKTSVAHNDVGALTLEYSATEVGGTLVDQALADGLEVAVEVATHAGGWTEPDGCRFLILGRDSDASDDAAVKKISAPSYGWLARKARNLDTANLLPSTHSQAGKRAFLAANAGEIVGTLLAENAARSGVPLTADFDTAADSAAAAWSKVLSVYYNLGLPLSDVIDNLASQGVMDWTTTARTLRMWNPDGQRARDLADTVRLHLGVDMAEAPSSESLEDLVSTVLVRGEDGLILTRSEPTAPTPWGQWEGYIEQGGVSDTATATLLADAELAGAARTRQQFTRKLILRDDAEPGTAWPLVDYRPGDWITAPTDTLSGERVRVQQVTLTFDGKQLGGNIVLHDRVLAAEIRRAKRMSGIVGGSSSGGSSGARPAPEGPDRRQPAAPAGLVVDTEAYIDAIGLPQGLLEATWGEVTTDTAGTLLEVAGYDLALRDNIAGAPWSVVVSVDGTEATHSPLQTGANLQAKVRARGRYSTTPGAWSAPVTFTVASDVTPPPVPDAPILTTRLGVLTVEWAGTPAMSIDFSHVEIALGDTALPETVVGQLDGPGELLVTGQPYGFDRWARLRSVDTSGNASAWSAVAGPVAATPVASADIDAAVTDAIDQALTGPIDGGRIDPWTVLSDRVLIGNVSNEVPNGSFSDGLSGWENPDGWSWLASHTDDASVTEYGVATRVADGTNATLLSDGVAVGIPVSEGEVWRWTVRHCATTDLVTHSLTRYLRLAGRMADGTPVFLTAAAFTSTGVWTTTSAEETIPAGMAYIDYVACWVNEGSTAGQVYVAGIALTRMTDAQLVVDGAITAAKLAANSVTADAIEAGSIDGMVITGAVVRTAGASSDRIELSGTSLKSITAGSTTIEMTADRLRVYDGGQIGGEHPGGGGNYLLGPMYLNGALLGRGVLAEDLDGEELLYIRSGTTLGDPTVAQVAARNGGNLFLDAYDGGAATLDTIGGGNLFIRSNDGGNVEIRATNSSHPLVTISGRGDGGIDAAAWSTDGTMVRSQLRMDRTEVTLLHIDGTGTYATGGVVLDGGGAAIYGTDGSGPVMCIETMGDAQVRIVNYANAGSSAVPVKATTSGVLATDSSTRRLKTDIRDHQVDAAAMLDVRVRSWQALADLEEDPDTAMRDVGFVAEELDEAGLPDAVIFGPSGDPIAIKDRTLIAGLVQLAQDHDARLAALEAAAGVVRQAARAVPGEATTSAQIRNIPPAPPARRRPPPGPVASTPTDATTILERR